MASMMSGAGSTRRSSDTARHAAVSTRMNDSADSSFIPSVQIPLDAEGARKVFKLVDALEDSDDVQNVYANFDISDDVMAEVDA